MKVVWLSVILGVLSVCSAAEEFTVCGFRAPAIPLVTIDPYTSVWSYTDHLSDDWPVHWTGAVHAMSGMARVDGEVYRFMGPEAVAPKPARPTNVGEVRPTQTVYTFTMGGVDLTLIFTTPMLPDDLKLLTAPVSFIDYAFTSNDGADHEVALYFDASAEWVVNEAKQKVTWDREDGPHELTLLSFASKDQSVLEKAGDNLRIDWGRFYVAFGQDWSGAVLGHETARGGFREKGAVAGADDDDQPRRAEDNWPVIACASAFTVGGNSPIHRGLTLAYDDFYSIEYMHEKLRPWWFKEYGSFTAMLDNISGARADILDRCARFDEEILKDAAQAGGARYADLLGLAYRQTFASGKAVVGPDDTLWFFHKENFSNGCTATVDVSYPASPFFALFAPDYLRGMLEPVFDFAMSDAWQWDFAPHDVGTYPKANGQRYNPGKIEGQMPVEECGNMILMAALHSRAAGDTDYAATRWDLLTKWADYLVAKGLDPENQLCTDDFAGHLAHNTNLSLKAINAIAAYAMMAEMLGKPEGAAYRAKAEEMAKQWVQMADDGDHFRLAFDKPGTWSMKYNLVWDRLFGLGLFDPAVARKEVAHYLKIQNRYGVPLDNRKDYTKTDWLVWCATLAEDPDDFQQIIAPLHLFCIETSDRVAFTDWYDTKTAKCVGFRARPVIGGIFIKLLADEAVWKKWRERAGG
ncbi:MAG: DUF4965 domain-containing protein [Candidatus Hydrogenedentes bacterium]|nr:DUF4965 domain-containing protein [Candidatus Hydrogenedentota bacterium]